MNGQFKENKSCFRVNERKGIHSSIGEKLAAILDDLHLILVYYRLQHPMLNFSPFEQELMSLFMKQYTKIKGQITVPMIRCFILLVTTSVLIHIT